MKALLALCTLLFFGCIASTAYAVTTHSADRVSSFFSTDQQHAVPANFLDFQPTDAPAMGAEIVVGFNSNNDFARPGCTNVLEVTAPSIFENSGFFFQNSSGANAQQSKPWANPYFSKPAAQSARPPSLAKQPNLSGFSFSASSQAVRHPLLN